MPAPSTMTKPVLPVIDLNEDFEEMLRGVHAHLLSTLGKHFTVQLLTTPAAAQRAIADVTVRAVVVSDKAAIKYVQPLLARGGTVVIGCLFSSFTNMSEFDATFKSLGLPWVHGSYYRTDHFPTAAAAQLLGSAKLPARYNAKALLVKGAAPGHMLYTPGAESVTQSLVFAPTPVADTNEAAVALAPCSGGGWVGYVGDVNGEEETSAVVLAMAQKAYSRQ